MNDNNTNVNDVGTYKAQGNLNTIIGNPNININDAMGVNIKNVSTNSVNNEVEVKNPEILNLQNTSVQNQNIQQINNQNSNINNNDKNNVQGDIKNKNINQNVNQNIDHNNSVNKTYVTTDNKPKKKNISLKLGPEFKIALLIIVILLVFIFLLPIFNKFIFGY